MKSITSRRLAVIDMPAMIASYFPPVSPGRMPSQFCATISHFALIRRHSSFARSISNPASVPSGFVKL